MAEPIDIRNAAVHGHVAALVTHPGYYYLYALYADYPIGNAWFTRREYAALLQERLGLIQHLLGMVQPYRKSEALRLFTERSTLERFPAERVAEAWRQLRELLERIGPPPGWPEQAPPEPAYAQPLPSGLRKRRRTAAKRAAAGQPARQAGLRPPKSPVDYTQDV
jgi:hypothetical protein